MTRLVTLGCFLACAELLAPAAAAETTAAEEVLRLELQAPAGCPRREAMLDAVTGLIRARGPTTLEVRAVIVEHDGRFHADLAMPGGQRRLDGATCRAVSAAIVVILALTIDPSAATNVAVFDLDEGAVGRDPPPAPAPLPPQPAPVQGGARTPRVVSPASRARRERRDEPRGREPPDSGETLRVGASALLLGELGILPAPALGGVALAHVRQRAWRVELGVGLLMPRSEHLASDTRAGGELRWASGQLNGCLTASEPFSACLGFEVGSVFGTGFGVDNERPASATWTATVASGSARFALDADLAFETRLALALPPSRPTFGVDRQVLHRPDAVSSRVLIGITFR